MLNTREIGIEIDAVSSFIDRIRKELVKYEDEIRKIEMIRIIFLVEDVCIIFKILFLNV